MTSLNITPSTVADAVVDAALRARLGSFAEFATEELRADARTIAAAVLAAQETEASGYLRDLAKWVGVDDSAPLLDIAVEVSATLEAYLDARNSGSVPDVKNGHARLDELAGLEPGWFEGEGQPMSPESLAAARVFLDTVGGHPGIFPHPEGFIRFEWVTGTTHVNIDFKPKNEDSDVYCFRIPGK